MVRGKQEQWKKSKINGTKISSYKKTLHIFLLLYSLKYDSKIFQLSTEKLFTSSPVAKANIAFQG